MPPSDTEPPPALPAPADPVSDHEEFDDLLETLEAEVGAPTVESTLALREAEIVELRSTLAALRPLGDQLAEVEKKHLAEEARHRRELAELRALVEEAHAEAVAREAERAAKLEELRGERDVLHESHRRLQRRLRRVPADLRRAGEIIAERELSLKIAKGEARSRDRELRRLAATMQKREAAIERVTARLEKLRTRHDERAAKAAERWKEILELRRRVKALETGSSKPRGKRKKG